MSSGHHCDDCAKAYYKCTCSQEVQMKPKSGAILDKIEQQWIAYVSETGRMPKYLFLGYRDMMELDNALGETTFRYRDMEVVGAERESFIGVCNKYSEM